MNNAEWQPIETAPKDGKRILLWTFYMTGLGSAYWTAVVGVWDMNRWVDWSDMQSRLDATHWMPLPEPPKEKA